MTDITSRPKMRTDEAAAYAGLSASTFEKMRSTGRGPTYIKVGKLVVYDISDIDAWLAANRRSSTSVAA